MPMPDSNFVVRPRKVRKVRARQATRPLPYPDYPLFHHGSGRWAKKVRGQLHYFGKVADDPTGKAALEKWEDDKADIYLGRKPSNKTGQRTILEICDRFLDRKQIQIASGELSQLTWNDYKRTCELILRQFGRTRAAASLTTDDFADLKATLAKTRGPVAIGNEIQRVRIIFRYAQEEGWIETVIRFGKEFKRPSAKVRRDVENQTGEKMIEAADLRRLIEAAGPAMKCMILLALNGGMGNSDVGHLPLAAIDLAGNWINFPRPKTSIKRRIPLWPETTDAIKAYQAVRPKPRSAEAEPLLFVTKYGEPWAKDDRYDNPVTKEFRKLLGTLHLHRRRMGFYWLRHVHRTISDGAKDPPAANHIMGHSDPSMAAVYRERIDDDRLRAVVDFVRGWLWPTMAKLAVPKKPR